MKQSIFLDYYMHGLLLSQTQVQASYCTKWWCKTNTTKTNTSHDSTTSTANCATKINVSYDACKFPFFVCSTIKKSLKSSTNYNIKGKVEDALSVIDDT